MLAFAGGWHPRIGIASVQSRTSTPIDVAPVIWQALRSLYSVTYHERRGSVERWTVELEISGETERVVQQLPPTEKANQYDGIERVVVLGDRIYSVGIPDRDSHRSRRDGATIDEYDPEIDTDRWRVATRLSPERYYPAVTVIQRCGKLLLGAMGGTLADGRTKSDACEVIDPSAPTSPPLHLSSLPIGFGQTSGTQISTDPVVVAILGVSFGRDGGVCACRVAEDPHLARGLTKIGYPRVFGSFVADTMWIAKRFAYVVFATAEICGRSVWLKKCIEWLGKTVTPSDAEEATRPFTTVAWDAVEWLETVVDPAIVKRYFERELSVYSAPMEDRFHLVFSSESTNSYNPC